ncbi:ABC transporter ATP-binding protein/permease [Verrucomicrobiaceae bacterium E54]|nr:ABC transporter ATP-binding protein/permease [Verrucomicrobiaceae bacterium E54]
MLPGTLHQNLLYGIDDPDGLDQALHDAALDAFIRQLPAGLDTRVGEKGPALSASQCQHLAIASAMLRKPRLIFFEEAGGRLGGEDAWAFHTALRRLFTGRTVMMIPCRESTFELASRTLIFRNGRIVFDGDAADAPQAKQWPKGCLETGGA